MKVSSEDARFLQGVLEDPRNMVCIVVHREPDLDAIGSALGVHHVLDQMGVKNTVWIPDIQDMSMSFLPGWEAIERRPVDMDAFSHVIALDTSRMDRINGFHDIEPSLRRVPILNIDHHLDNPKYGTFNLIGDVSSVGELMVALIQMFNWPMSSDTATCLYAGIAYDTGQFRNSNVTSLTFERAGWLLSHGADPCWVGQKMYESVSVRGMRHLQHALERMVVDLDRGIVYTSVLSDFRSEVKVVEYLRALDRVNVCVVFNEENDGHVRVSLRSKTDFDVAAFSAQFGGGGHKRASGIRIRGSLSDVTQMVMNRLEAALVANP